jgi:hypothetical protein
MRKSRTRSVPTGATVRESSRNRTSKYTGVLAEPIRIKHHTRTLLDCRSEKEVAEANGAEWAHATEALISKFDLLFEHFKIERTDIPADDYYALAMSLALKHVPGMRFVSADSPRRGHRKVRDPVNLMRLLADVEVIKRRKKMVRSRTSDAPALADLTTSSTFKPRWGRYRGKERTLANWLAEARDPKRNPFYRLWQLKGRVGETARAELIATFSIISKDGL